MLPGADTLYAALVARENRLDGQVFVCVTSTGIYCRLVCPARTPLRRNVVFRGSAAEWEAAGFRACKRCRPADALIASFGRSSPGPARRPTEPEG